MIIAFKILIIIGLIISTWINLSTGLFQLMCNEDIPDNMKIPKVYSYLALVGGISTFILLMYIIYIICHN